MQEATMDLSGLTRKKLYEIAKEKKIIGRSKMKKAELIKSIQKLNKLSTNTEEKKYISSQTSDNKTEEISSKEKPTETQETDYKIPERYNIDTLVLLPVNPQKEFVFWEVSDATEEKFKTELMIDKVDYFLKIFKINGHSAKELKSVMVDKIGNYYFDIDIHDDKIWCELGVLNKNNEFCTILASKKIKIPGDKPSSLEQLDFMEVDENLNKIYQMSGFYEENTGYFEFKKNGLNIFNKKERA